jgi:general secretion pathway protein A
MYIEFFSLKEQPYSMSPDPRFIYLTDQHSEALAKCEYTIQQRMGLSVIHGDVGAGKTTLARRLWEKYAHDAKYNFAMLVDPNYPTSFQFINEVRRELNINNPRRSFGDALNEFQQYLVEQHKMGKTTILVVDEAQTLRSRNYELLRKLLNFETNTEKLLQIVLFGQNELLPRLDRVPALKDRVALFGPLSRLTRSDTDDLIKFRWNLAGGRDLPFTDAALETIYRITMGSPRKVCKLCDNVLIAIFLRGVSSADESVVVEVAQDIRLQEQMEGEKKDPDTLEHQGDTLNKAEGENGMVGEEHIAEGEEHQAPQPEEMLAYEGDNMKQTYGKLQ